MELQEGGKKARGNESEKGNCILFGQRNGMTMAEIARI
jgi:hypothetical protein